MVVVAAGADLPAGESRPFARSFDEMAGESCSVAPAEPTTTLAIAFGPLATARALDLAPRRGPEGLRPRPFALIGGRKNGEIAGPDGVRGWPYRVERRKSPRVPWPVFSRGLRLNEFGHTLSMSLALVDRGEKRLLLLRLKKSIADILARDDRPRLDAHQWNERQHRDDGPS